MNLTVEKIIDHIESELKRLHKEFMEIDDNEYGSEYIEAEIRCEETTLGNLLRWIIKNG